METEPLKPEEFDAHIRAGTLRLALVGMANAGKSYRAKVLSDKADFLRYSVDDKIQNALAVDDLSAWMGYPSSGGYAEREKKYLELENTFTRKAAMQTDGKNLVFDTTGSVVHLLQDTLQVLSQNCLIVHLDVGDESLTELITKFFETPKPIAWDGFFEQKPGEGEIDALRRCYPILLRERLARYRALAHVAIRAHEIHDKSAPETLGMIRDKLT